MHSRKLEAGKRTVSTGLNECIGASGGGQPTGIPLDLGEKKYERNTQKITSIL
jgi:hypothetical protein